MADITFPVIGGGIKTLDDMGDGTHAERVVAVPMMEAGVDRSGAVTIGGTAQELAPANDSRRSLTGQNISAGDLWINEIGGTAAADTAGSYKVPAGATFAVSTSRSISIFGATTGQKFTATEV